MARGALQVTIEADKAAAFIDALQSGSVESAVKAYGVEAGKDGSLGRHPSRDPRRFGVTGAYPRSGGRGNRQLRERLYEEVGVWGAIVDQWAEDTWGEGFRLETKDESWSEEAGALLSSLRADMVFEDADKQAIQHDDGYCLIHVQVADSTGNPREPVQSASEVIRLNVIPAGLVQGVETITDIDDPNFGDPVAVDIQFGQGQRTVAWNRIVHLREYPKIGEPLKGISRAKRWSDDVLLWENTKWSAGESFHQRAAPFLQATIDPLVKLTEEDARKIKEDIDDLQSAVIQKIIAEGFELKPVTGASSLVSPGPYKELAMDSIGASSRVPKHFIFGTQAGALASASEDSKRYYGKVSRRQEKYAAPSIRSLLERFSAWGLLPAFPEDLQIVFNALDEPTTLEVVEQEKMRADALAVYKNNDLLPPQDLTSYEPGEFHSAPGPVEAMESHGDRGVLLLKGAEDKLVPWPWWRPEEYGGEALPPEAKVEVPELKAVRLRFLSEWQVALSEAVDRYMAPFQDDDRVSTLPEGQDQLDPDDPAIAALLEISLGSGYFSSLLFNVYMATATVGIENMSRQIRASIKHALNEADEKVFRTLALATSESQAEAITSGIRRVIGEGVANGEGLRQIRSRVLAQFDKHVTRADMVVRTESMRGYNYGARAELRAAGGRRFEFAAFNAACSICAPLDGQQFLLTDSANTPPLHPHCRCVPIAVPEDFVEESA